MQETLIKQTLHTNEFHTRLWWMEVIRGVVNIIFGHHTDYSHQFYITYFNLCPWNLSDY